MTVKEAILKSLEELKVPKGYTEIANHILEKKYCTEKHIPIDEN